MKRFTHPRYPSACSVPSPPDLPLDNADPEWAGLEGRKEAGGLRCPEGPLGPAWGRESELARKSVAFEHRPKWNKGQSHVEIWGEKRSSQREQQMQSHSKEASVEEVGTGVDHAGRGLKTEVRTSFSTLSETGAEEGQKGQDLDFHRLPPPAAWGQWTVRDTEKRGAQ